MALNPLHPLESLSNFVGNVENSIQITFRVITEFIHWIMLLALNIYFFIVVGVFFALIALAIIIPIWIYPRYMKIKALYYKFMEGMQKPYNRDR